MAREQYEAHWKDYYKVLQVHPRAEQTVITVTYRKLAQRYHPDHNKNSDATDRFKEINEAYEVLSDRTRRNRYDEVYRLQQVAVTSRPRARQHRTSTRAYHQESTRESTREGTMDRARGPTRAAPHGRPRPREGRSYPSNQRTNGSSKGFFSGLADTVSPDADESQRVLPRLPWAWQRLFLIGAVPLGMAVLAVALGGAGWGAVALAIPLLAGSIYAGVATSWLRRSRDAPLAARIAAGACIIVSGFIYVVGVVVAILSVRFIILGLKVAGKMMRKRRDGGMNK